MSQWSSLIGSLRTVSFRCLSKSRRFELEQRGRYLARVCPSRFVRHVSNETTAVENQSTEDAPSLALVGFDKARKTPTSLVLRDAEAGDSASLIEDPNLVRDPSQQGRLFLVSLADGTLVFQYFNQYQPVDYYQLLKVVDQFWEALNSGAQMGPFLSLHPPYALNFAIRVHTIMKDQPKSFDVTVFCIDESGPFRALRVQLLYVEHGQEINLTHWENLADWPTRLEAKRRWQMRIKRDPCYLGILEKQGNFSPGPSLVPPLSPTRRDRSVFDWLQKLIDGVRLQDLSINKHKTSINPDNLVKGEDLERESPGPTATVPDSSAKAQGPGPGYSIGYRRHSATLAGGTLVFDALRSTKEYFTMKVNAVNHFWYQFKSDKIARTESFKKEQSALQMIRSLQDSESLISISLIIWHDARPYADSRERSYYRLHLTDTTSGLSFTHFEVICQNLPREERWKKDSQPRIIKDALLRGYLGKLDEHGQLEGETATTIHPLKLMWQSAFQFTSSPAELGLERVSESENRADTNAGLKSSHTAFSACISDGPLVWASKCKHQQDFKMKLELAHHFWQDPNSLFIREAIPDHRNIGIKIFHIGRNVLDILVYNTVAWLPRDSTTRKWLPCQLHLSRGNVGWSYRHATFSTERFTRSNGKARRMLTYENMEQPLSHYIGSINERELTETSPSVHPLLEDYSRQNRLARARVAVLSSDPVELIEEVEIEPRHTKAEQRNESHSEFHQTDGKTTKALTTSSMPFSASIVDGPLVWCERKLNPEEFKMKLEIVNQFWQTSKSLELFRSIPDHQNVGLRLRFPNSGRFGVAVYQNMQNCHKSVMYHLHLSHVDLKRSYSHSEAVGDPNFADTRSRKSREVRSSDLESALSHHVGSIDQQGHLHETLPSVHPLFNQWRSRHEERTTAQVEFRPAVSSVDDQDTKKGSRSIGLKTKEKGKRQSGLQAGGEITKVSTFHERIAATMRLARGVHEMDGYLEKELDAIPLRTRHNAEKAAKGFSTPNLVQNAISGTEVDVESMRTSIQNLKARLTRREDGTNILILLLEKWRKELHEQYPLTNSDKTITTEDSRVARELPPVSGPIEMEPVEQDVNQNVYQTLPSPDEPETELKSDGPKATEDSNHQTSHPITDEVPEHIPQAEDSSSDTPSPKFKIHRVPTLITRVLSDGPKATEDPNHNTSQPKTDKEPGNPAQAEESTPSSNLRIHRTPSFLIGGRRSESIYKPDRQFKTRSPGRMSGHSLRDRTSKDSDRPPDDDEFSPFAL